MIAEKKRLIHSRYQDSRFIEKDVPTDVLIFLFFTGTVSIFIASWLWIFIDPFSTTKTGDTSTLSHDASSIYNNLKNTFLSVEPEKNNCDKRIVGLYSELSKPEIVQNQLSKLTHAILASLYLTHNGSLAFRNETEKNWFMTLKNTAAMGNSTAKLMVSVGGDGYSMHFPIVTRRPARKRVLINSILSFLEEHSLDGVDIFWKWPRTDDKHTFFQFLFELKERLKMRRENYTLSIVVPPQNVGYDGGFKMKEIVEIVDFINIFSMDYYGPWSNHWGNPTGPISPMYGGSEHRERWNVQYTTESYSCEAQMSSKFNIVIPFFARLWNNVGEFLEYPGREVYRQVKLVHGATVGDRYIPRWSALQQGYNLSSYSYDGHSEAAFIYNSTTEEYLTFESEMSIAAKMAYVQSMNLGGVWIWTLDMDDEIDRLLDFVVFDEKQCSIKNSQKYDCTNS